MLPADRCRRIVAGERRALATAISLCESTRSQDAEPASQLVELAHGSLAGKRTFRVGVTGPPGAGKSTLVEQLGQMWLEAGRRVAVLAIDPASERTGGSLLGDQTRMPMLSVDSRAFVRASSARDALGGVSLATRDSIVLCEAAGYDLVVIETVGVGQSEGDVANLVDGLLLVLAPGGGDELQALKRGITELSDIVAINKADGVRTALAEQSCSEYRGALGVLRGIDPPPVVLISAKTQRGLTDLKLQLEQFERTRRESGALLERRAEQRVGWFRRGLTLELRRWLQQQAGLQGELLELERRLKNDELSVRRAIRDALSRVRLVGTEPGL